MTPRKRGPGRPPLGRRARSVIRSVRLADDEAARQDEIAGKTPWAKWARDQLVAAAPPTPVRSAARRTSTEKQ